MTQAATLPLRYDRWKAPAEDGHTLIWPAPEQLLRDLRDNHDRLTAASSAHIQGVAFNEVRSRMRGWLGHDDPDQPIIATGHQAELHHPGVWVKNALINAVAQRTAGRAIHFAVDTDEPKHLQLRWPGGAVALTDVDRPQAQWSALVPAPTPAHLHDVEQAFAAASKDWGYEPLVAPFIHSMRRLALEATNLPSALTNAVHELDWSLGLRHDAMLVSPICMSEPYLLFVHHVLARADQFAADYNASLEEFRRENKIRTQGRPMPNLKCLPEGCESPFWLDDLTSGERTRAAVSREAGQFALNLPGGERFALDPDADGWTAAGKLMLFLRSHGFRLSPRALTLTAVLRLLVADQFVHGIGGGRYDQVLDKLIARHFQIEPPRFSVTTATLYLPTAASQPRLCVPCIAQESHHFKHGLLGAEKKKWVNAIAQAPRYSIERSVLFNDLHEKLAAARSGEAFKRWEQDYIAAGKREQEEKVLFDRELFYAMQPRERLEAMIEKCRSAFGE